MKAARMVSSLVGVALIGSVGACSSPVQLHDPDVAVVKIIVTDHGGPDAWEPSTEAGVAALVLDDRGVEISGETVTWQLQLPNGQVAPDSIASLTTTGSVTARVAFWRDGVVGVVATARRSDGTTKSDVLYLTADPGPCSECGP